MTGSFVTAYWWVIIFALLAFVVLFLSLDRKKSRQGSLVSSNYIEGLKAMIENDDQNAFVRFKQAVAEDSDNVDAYLRLGDLLRKRGQIQKAVQIHRQLLLRQTLDKESITQIWKSLATDFISARRFNLAQEILEKISQEQPHRKWARERLLEIFEKTGRFDAAFEVARELYKADDQQAKLAIYRYLEGNQHFEKKDYHKARLAYKEALKFDEKFAPAYVKIAESYLVEDKKESAVEYFIKLTQAVPCEAHQVFQKMEQALFELGRYSDVEQIYLNLMRDCPNDPRILHSYAAIAEKKGNLGAAIDSLNQAINIDPSDMTAISKLAQLYIDNGQKQKALKMLQDLRNHNRPLPLEYECAFCARRSAIRELQCPVCNRVGPYQKIQAA